MSQHRPVPRGTAGGPRRLLLAGAAVVVALALAVVAVRVLGGEDDDPGAEAAAGAAAVSSPGAGSSAPTSTSAAPSGAASPTSPTDPTGPATPGADAGSAGATPSASGSSEAATSPGSTPTSRPGVPTEAPSVAVADLLTDLAGVLRSGSDAAAPDLGALDERAVGVALGELEAQATEYHDQGWRQVGVTKVVWVRGQRALDPSGTTIRVRACLDSTAVQVVDDAGREVPGYTGSRSVNLLDLTAVDGSWKISARSFPDEADC